MISTLAVPKEDKPPQPEWRPSHQELWHRYRGVSDPRVEEALVQQYVPLVKTIVGRLAMTLPAHVSTEDLNSAGLIGLLQAIRSFDPHCGGEIVLDQIRTVDQSRLIRRLGTLDGATATKVLAVLREMFV